MFRSVQRQRTTDIKLADHRKFSIEHKSISGAVYGVHAIVASAWTHGTCWIRYEGGAVTGAPRVDVTASRPQPSALNPHYTPAISAKSAALVVVVALMWLAVIAFITVI
jgi:hypothetical protein